ncbi:MAG TPA: hypothetical protein VHB53_00520, partial [Solirubrobacterales bacterium]|nr:hypothetical protein [Solirubrobacterales bacterium]
MPTKEPVLPYPSCIAPRQAISLLATAAVGVALSLPAAAAASDSPSWAPDVPWGAGCEPAHTPARRTAANCGATLVDGEAIPPPGAPPAVKRVIAAADEIDNRPYIWGGGHASFIAKGYDCSGAVSYALHGAGLLSYTMVSGQLAHYGSPGPGRWITIYANAEHVFMVVAGLRFDTRN